MCERLFKTDFPAASHCNGFRCMDAIAPASDEPEPRGDLPRGAYIESLEEYVELLDYELTKYKELVKKFIRANAQSRIVH